MNWRHKLETQAGMKGVGFSFLSAITIGTIAKIEDSFIHNIQFFWVYGNV